MPQDLAPGRRASASMASASVAPVRIPAATVVGMVADGLSEAEILEAYPDLEREDVREALRFAAEAVRERELPLVRPA